jgi:hypothetical protein
VACLTVLSEVYLPWSLVVSRLGRFWRVSIAIFKISCVS